ncbi:uncharacterized protein [Aegilops tauschii subsp. strangulata]|uniref:uncharacterized protein n=1 Tax=Aegilops tauschii subsp. strangulata TaxID=200361 RepID=UPI001ABC66A4|nr:uncharacterized protein LOC120975325 [Aegilops tauschii subsp. strangulata]
MALTEAKKPTSADSAGEDSSSSSMALAEPGGASEAEPLGPSVYFSPTREECLLLLDRWIGGDDDMADARGLVSQTNFYSVSPDALRRLHPPATARDDQRAWWFLSETKPQTTRAGGGAKRADRRVDTGGHWRPEERRKEEQGDAGNCFAFYSGPSKKGRTPWRVQELTSDKGKKKGAYALYRLYLSRRASEEELRAVYGDDGVPAGSERPARATVPAECFDAVAALLPPGSVRGGLGPQASQQPDELAVEEGCLITLTGLD